jgi:Fic family protein
MLFRPPVLTSPEIQVIESIAKAKETISFATNERRWVGLLRRNAFARAIRGSNSIEGYNVTVEDAIAAAVGDQPADASPQLFQVIEGYRNAMTYALQLSDDPHFVYEEGLIRALHFMIMNYDLAKSPGKWRPGPIFVRNDDRGEIVYEGPEAEQVPKLMGEFVESLKAKDSLPVVVRAAMAHLNLVMIHPFSDGNGRMARCLQTLVLAREKILHPWFCSIEEYLGANSADYYKILAATGEGKWNPKNNTRAWIRFCLTAHYRQGETLLRRQRMMSRLWGELESQMKRHKLPERMMGALIDAAMGLHVRNATYRAWAEVSDNLASRDLKILVDAGFLEPKGDRRGRSYIASVSLSKVASQFRERGPIPDPFIEVGQTKLF